MSQRTVKSALITSIFLAMFACTNTTIPDNSKLFPAIENFQDLDREYTFKTKELTRSYLKRKIEKWLCRNDQVGQSSISCPYDEKLVKEIAYASHKHRELFCAIVTEDNSILDDINAVQAVQDRKGLELSFSDFLESCIVAPSPVTGELQVNTDANGETWAASTAMDNDGNFVVIWSGYGNSSGIYARRYNSTGSPLGSEFKVSSEATGQKFVPFVAMDSDGDFIITWSSNGQDGDNDSVFARRYNSTGSSLGSEFQVNSFTTHRQHSSVAAMDNNGDFVITWYSYTQDGSHDGIFAQRYSSSGSMAGSEFLVSPTTNPDAAQLSPFVAMDNAGDFIISWSGFGSQDGDISEIYAKRYSSDGTLIGSEFQVNSYTTDFQYNSTIAMDNAGDFVIAWQSSGQDGSNGGIYARRYSSSGIPISSEFRVNTYTTENQYYPSAAMDNDGDFVITWNSYIQDEDSYYGVYAQRYSSAGFALGSEFIVNSYTTMGQWEPSAAMDGDGDFVVVWSSYPHEGDNHYGVFARRYNNQGVAQ
jgi:hypothetical protein